MTGIRNLTGSVLVAGAFVLSACSSGGGSGAPSEDKILAKLKGDSNVTKLKAQLPASAQSKFPVVEQCIAKALKKDADSGDLNDYVNGDKSLDDVGGDEGKAKTDLQNCVKASLSG